MKSTYIPPHLRGKPEPKIVASDFPALSPGLQRKPSWKQSETFAKLAKEWHTTAQEAKETAEMKDELERQNRIRSGIFTIRHTPAQKQEEAVYESSPSSHADEWELVDRTKPVRDLTLEERYARDMKREQEDAYLAQVYQPDDFVDPRYAKRVYNN